MLNEVEEELQSEIEFFALVIFPSDAPDTWKSPGTDILVSASPRRWFEKVCKIEKRPTTSSDVLFLHFRACDMQIC